MSEPAMHLVHSAAATSQTTFNTSSEYLCQAIIYCLLFRRINASSGMDRVFTYMYHVHQSDNVLLSTADLPNT